MLIERLTTVVCALHSTDAQAREMLAEILAVLRAQDARPFKRGADPKGCGYRSGGDCASIGVSLHCKLEAGHQPLGHDFRASGDSPYCFHALHSNPNGYTWTYCNQTREAHGTPHAMEVSDRYVLEHLEERK